MNQIKNGSSKKTIAFLLVVTTLLNACATQSKSLALGGVIGAGTGAVLGGIASPGKDGEFRTRNVIVGSAVGGMAGMLTGAIIHENTENKKRDAFLAGQKAATPKPKTDEAPKLTQAQVEARWIEGKVQGNRYVDGHWEYLITEPARWEDSK